MARIHWLGCETAMPMPTFESSLEEKSGPSQSTLQEWARCPLTGWWEAGIQETTLTAPGKRQVRRLFWDRRGAPGPYYPSAAIHDRQ